MRSSSRRTFLKQTTGVLTGLGLGGPLWALATPAEAVSRTETMGSWALRNPILYADQAHPAPLRRYSLSDRLQAARAAGFDGFEFSCLTPGTQAWREARALMTKMDFRVWGMYTTTRAVLDRYASHIPAEIARIEALVQACARTPVSYLNLSLSGNGELRGDSIADSGSARAEKRHWARAAKIISAFDRACARYGMQGSLYPHIYWLCDTPESQVRILAEARAQHIGMAFCAQTCFAHPATSPTEKALDDPMRQRLKHVELTNGHLNGNGFAMAPFDQGEIDITSLLSQLHKTGYNGPISTQGWGPGEDPFQAGKVFVESINQFRQNASPARNSPFL